MMRVMIALRRGVVFRSCFVLATAFLLVACGDKAREQAPVKIFQEERQALDKAKGVQQTLDQQEQEKRKQVDEQTK